MTYAIVYSSRTGNTRMLARTVKDALPADSCIYYGPPDHAALNADRIFVGFWTDKGSCDAQTAAFLKLITYQEIFLFGTAGFGGSRDYFDKIIHRTLRKTDRTVNVVGSFMCQGKMPTAVRERYEKLLKSPVRPPHLRRMIDNFDRAQTHPDIADLADIRKTVQGLHAKH